MKIQGARFYLVARAISKWSRNRTKSSAPPASQHLSSSAACSRVLRFATYINNGHEYSESEDTLLLPSESEALSDMRWYRDDRRVFQGRLPWRYELAPLPRGCSLEYPPSCLFSAIPSSPFFLLSVSSLFLSRSLSLSFSLRFSLFHYCHPSRFSPPYTYVFTRPASPSLFLQACRPFRLFCSQADSPMEATRWLAWPLFSFFPSSSPTSNRASSTLRFYFVTASLIPALSALRYTSLLPRGIVAR